MNVHLLIIDTYPAEYVAGDDMEAGGVGSRVVSGMVTDATYETAPLRHNVDCRGDIQFHATYKGVDVYCLIFGDDSIAQVEADATKAGIKLGTVEWFAVVEVFVATISGGAADPFALLGGGHGAS